MRALATISDPVYRQDTQYSALDRFFLQLIRDKRDLPFVYLTIRITLLMIPTGILLYLPFITGWVWWGLAVAYFIMNNFVFKGPFGLMLHCTSHRKFFKKEYGFMNHYLPWFVAPFFGQTPETYFSHHIGMHHPENNLPEDESTTMPYQRDRFGDFMRYFGDFFFLGMVRLTGYFIRKKRKKLMRRSITGELLFIAGCVGLSFINFPATFMVFILPFLISRFVMMVGNWGQHAFIDPADPGNAYTNSVTCINAKYNHKCWNDGYHISHHIKPTLHWTEHPNHLTENRHEYVKNKALIFEGIDFLGVFSMLMRKKYDKLADHIVNLDNMWESREELITTMKHRTQKIPIK